jgi:hypothetical protein
MARRFVAAISMAGTIACATTASDGAQPSTNSSNANQMTFEQCNEQYSGLRKDLEAAAQPIRDVKQRRAPTTGLCGLITAYGEVEVPLIEFIDANSTQCRFPANIGENTRTTHLTTERLKAEACNKPQAPWRE